jgi:glycosyltransferase involved in cell wall biosynthesis
VNQGRALDTAALGHARVRDALELAAPSGDVELHFEDIRPFTRAERLLVRPLPLPRGRGYTRLRWHLTRGVVARRQLGRRIDGLSPDVLHVTTDQIAFLLDRLQRRVPCVMSMDTTTYEWVRMIEGLPERGSPPPALRQLMRLNRLALEHAPLCIAWTESVAEAVRRLAPAARTAVLHPGLDLEAFKPTLEPRRQGPMRVLFVGGEWTRKGGDDLIAALGDDLDRSVRIDAVTGSEVPARPGLTLHRAGPGSAELRELFARADVLCLPSRADAVPWVVIEAIASGVPVVASAIGSIPELVGDSGVIVPPGDVRALREALSRLRTDDALRAGMGAAGRERAEKTYDARKNGPELLSLLREVAGGRQ